MVVVLDFVVYCCRFYFCLLYF